MTPSKKNLVESSVASLLVDPLIKKVLCSSTYLEYPRFLTN